MYTGDGIGGVFSLYVSLELLLLSEEDEGIEVVSLGLAGARRTCLGG